MFKVQSGAFHTHTTALLWKQKFQVNQCSDSHSLAYLCILSVEVFFVLKWKNQFACG